MAKCKIFEPSVSWNKDFVTDTAPGIDKKLWKWHRNAAVAGSSKYASVGSASKTMATINTGIWNAFVDYLAALGKKGDHSSVAIGKNAVLYMAETSLPDGSRQIATYNTTTKAVEAATVTTSGRYLPYDLSKASQECGRVIFLALFPELLRDEEAEEAFNIIADLFVKDDIENDVAGNAMSKLSDNFYRRIENSTFEIKIPTSGNVRMIPSAKIKTGAYAPDSVLGGEFKIFNNDGSTSVSVPKAGITVKEAIERFKDFMAGRIYTAEEEEFLKQTDREVPDDTPVPLEVLELATLIVNSSKDRKPVRNATMRGETGYGKSYNCKILSKILRMVYIVQPTSPTMETSDFLSKFVPDAKINNTGLEGIEFPSLEEVMYDTATAFKKITGIYNEDVTPEECYKALVQAQVDSEIKNREESSGENSAPSFKHVCAPYAKALGKGYLCEIQESKIIKDSAVMAGLNPYNEPGSIILLADGTYMKRDANAVVIITDNVGYEGLRPSNQSVIRRNFYICDCYQMSKEEVIARVKKMSEFDDDEVLEFMYKVWEFVREFCSKNGITDGSTSIEELSNWAQAYRLLGASSLRRTCITTVISKATEVLEEQEAITSSVLDAFDAL